MRVALLTRSSEVDLPRIGRPLEELGIEIITAQGVSDVGALCDRDVARCFMVSQEPSLVAVGEQIDRLRHSLNGAVQLIACAPRPTAADREVLHECGASDVITPEGWRPDQVAERILADLILVGAVVPSSSGGLLGATLTMRDLYQRIEKVAPLNEPVLILGETGTGKELVAREIHRRSGRPGDLLAINCAALTPELLESELFGHERGAFTNALTARKGLLVEGGQGTVFLDEIGDLALSSQAKLLRVLEERKVRPVGSNRWLSADARIVLATHRDLEEACADGRFREDLFHRISGLALRLSPLRERKADLLLLASHFLASYNKEYPGARFAPPGAFDPLFRYHWPGNVRELRMAIWQAATFGSGTDGPIGALSLQEWTRRESSPAANTRWQIPFNPLTDSWKEVQDRARKAYFRSVLRESGGNKDEAAKRAGMSRSQFYEILKQVNADEDPAG